MLKFRSLPILCKPTNAFPLGIHVQVNKVITTHNNIWSMLILEGGSYKLTHKITGNIIYIKYTMSHIQKTQYNNNNNRV